MTSTTGKNRSILAGIVGAGPVTDTPTVAAPRAAVAPERLSSRMTGLARVTSGDIKEKTLKLVDPARCRMWSRHNRRYDLLNIAQCADLLESLRAQGEQEFPAIVRRVEGDPDHDYEIICGARRHWSISYLRRVEHRDIRFLIEERELSDEAAFRLADVENRSRKDICDYERALDYLQAVDVYYGGVAQRMAERLDVSKTWLSRFLDLAKMPTEVVEAFGDIRNIRENHARELKPYVADPIMGPRVIAEAQRLNGVQSKIRANGQTLIDAAKVVAALKSAAASSSSASTPREPARMVTNASGELLFTLAKKGSKKIVLEVSLEATAPTTDFLAAFQYELDRLRR